MNGQVKFCITFAMPILVPPLTEYLGTYRNFSEELKERILKDEGSLGRMNLHRWLQSLVIDVPYLDSDILELLKNHGVDCSRESTAIAFYWRIMTYSLEMLLDLCPRFTE